MTRSNIVAAFALAVGLSLGVAPPVVLSETGTAGMPAAAQTLTGTVSAIKSGLVVVQTSAGKIRLQAKNGLSDAKVGDAVTMWVNENNFVMAVQKKGAPAPVHRLVAGKLAWSSDDKNEVKLWTPDGEKSFPVERGRSKIFNLKEGTPITVELNEQGKVVDVHSITMTIQVEPGKGPNGSNIKMTGVVTKMQSGIVTVKTPTTDLHLNQKRGLGDVKVGDEVTVWVNESNVVMSVQKQGASAPVHRLVAGTVVSVSDNAGEVTVQTPEGEKTYAVASNRSKLAMLKSGTGVTIELDEAGKVVDLRKTS